MLASIRLRFQFFMIYLIFSWAYSFPSKDNEKRWHPELGKTKLFKGLEAELDSNYWEKKGLETVENHIKVENTKKIAKNIIFFMGDGMSVNTITAARAYLDTTMVTPLTFEQFPHTGMAKNYCVNKQTADSACTTTAYLCGVKSNFDMIGVTANVQQKNCSAAQIKENQTPSIGKWALDVGKAVGFITTATVTDASPVGLYGHTSERNWECDIDVIEDGCDPETTPDIAKQLIRGEVGSKLKVIMGGGRKEFRPNTTEDEEENESYGRRLDGLDLIEEWKKSKNGTGQYIWNMKQLKEVDPSETDYILGLFDYGSMKYNLELMAEGEDRHEPSLYEMTEKAIDILSKEDQGYFLFIEGGLIDNAHHNTYATLALDETVELSRAIQTALNKVNIEETLIVVTADHAHTMSFTGYPDRVSNILGTVGTLAKDDMDQMILSYGNGPGYDIHRNISGSNRIDPRTLEHYFKLPYPSTFPRGSETHGGEDVSVYAIGPWSHLFSGNYEQHVIAHLMAYASCIGPGTWTCSSKMSTIN